MADYTKDHYTNGKVTYEVPLKEVYIGDMPWESGASYQGPSYTTATPRLVAAPGGPTQEARIAELERKYKALEFLVEHLLKETPATPQTTFRD